MSQGYKLLTPGNPKTLKGVSSGFWTFILHFAPHRLSGHNVCSNATAGCIEACLNTAGRGGMMAGVSRLTLELIQNGARNTIQSARIRRTQWFFADRAGFMKALVKDIERAIRKAEQAEYTPVFRLNGTSDIRWESVACWRDGKPYRSIMAAFPAVQFYDYTKITNRKNIPANYHLTFSLADGNDAAAREALERGFNVAAVFRNKATVAHYEAAGFMGHPVFNGDETDLRFLDPAHGHIIALYAKGNAKGDRTGFVRD